MKYFLAPTSIILLVTIVCHPGQGPEQLPSGAKVTSPDKKIVAVYNPDQLEIRDVNTDQLYESVTVSLIYALRWTRDSSSLIAVEQIAHGSDAVVLHRNARDWTSFRITPPGDSYKDYAVVALKAQQSSFEITYRVSGPAALYVISFAIDPATRAISDVRREEVGFDEWSKLPMFGDKE